MKRQISPKPRIAIAHQQIALDSVIGFDILGMYDFLTSMGLYVVIIGEVIDPKIQNNYQTQILKISSNIEFDILIYHHSDAWKLGRNLLNQFCGEIIFKCHELIPPHFFKPYSHFHKLKSEENYNATKCLIEQYSKSIWMFNTSYNRSKLINLGLDPKNTYLANPFQKINLKINNNKNNRIKKLLYDGDFEPHKGHKILLKILKEYVNSFSPKIELQLIGNTESVPAYMHELIYLMEKYDLENYIKIFTNINMSDREYFYQNADIFLCFSEHEDFCASLLTAQSFGLPIITCNKTSIKEILGDYPLGDPPKRKRDFFFYAYLIDEILKKKLIYSDFDKQGINNLISRFQSHHNERSFFKVIYPVLENYK